MKKIVSIAGGTGFIGRFLAEKLHKKGFEIRILSRDIKKFEKIFSDYKQKNIIPVYWDDNSNPEQLAEQLDGSDYVINLSGVNVADKRWNPEFKKILYDSRINSTKLLTTVFSKMTKKPTCFVSISGVGYYGNRFDEKLDENSSQGNDFLANLVKDWEAASQTAISEGIRTVNLRTGIVLDKNNGALKELKKPFEFFVGGYISPGSQYMSFIHIDDLTDLIIFCLENNAISGIVNAVSPEPITNKEFSKKLAKVMNRPCLFPVPEFALKIIVGEFASSLTGGQRVYPLIALKNNFPFKFPNLDSALNNLFTKK